jgi:hypothetical protein
MEVKKRVETEAAEAVPTHASASPVKRVIATATPGTGKKTIVLHKSSVKAAVARSVPQVKWETVIEVVKPSHYRPRSERFDRPERTERTDRPFRSERGERTFASGSDRSDRPRRDSDFRRPDRGSSGARTGASRSADNRSAESRESSTGGTFADFIRAAEERKKRDEERRKGRK